MQDLLSAVSIHNIKAAYKKNIYNEGYEYYACEKVQELSTTLISSTKFLIKGSVITDNTYQVVINIESSVQTLNIDSHCTCAVKKDCAHSVALLLKALDANQNKNIKIDTDKSYIKDLKKSLNDSLIVKDNDNKYQIHYIIEYLNKTNICVNALVVKVLQNNNFLNIKKFDKTYIKHQQYLQAIDVEILEEINNINSKVFKMLIDTKRCHLEDINAPIINLSDTRLVKEVLYINNDNTWRTVLEYNGVWQEYFYLDKLWYIDKNLNVCGELEHNKTIDLNYLQDTSKDIINITVDIKPILRLFEAKVIEDYSHKSKVVLAELYFNYNGHEIPWHDNSIEFRWCEDEKIYKITRDFIQEAQYILDLQSLNLKLVKDILHGKDFISAYANMFILDKDIDPLKFSQEIMPRLTKKNWDIKLDIEYSYQFVEYEEKDWYSEVSFTQKTDWFDLNLGIIVDGEKINLLPIFVEILKNVENFNDLEQEFLVTKLPNNKYIKLPVVRLKKIANILVELYDVDNLNTESKLQLSKLHAARLLELEASFDATKLRWFGYERLKEFAQKLQDFDKIKQVKAPTHLQNILRHYQHEGLNWLQFLREYEFGGILADDMGLGKTIQTLSHILVEKDSGRMHGPCLVVTPTSLIFNWQLEAQKFTPTLKVLVLHGGSRQENFSAIMEYDLVLTTYPLLSRDKDALLDMQFYLLILDEAQYIKNYKTKATQIALQLKAKHRLCLTGTPMENHLGELWSLFHFMMPGLLGTYKFFNKVFKNPIEKYNDFERQKYLNKRIAPFLLRRTKSNVLKELPQKVEIIRYIELNESQRDLYETIRLTLQDKLLQNIAHLGIMRSRIIILDALLKLRQICCDPKLVKLEAVQSQNIASAKRDFLINLVLELLAEGRKILIFSQFTQMLKIIENDLQEKNIKYALLTGKTKDRQNQVELFQNGEAGVFLVSLKAGGVGLNLTAADTVIHYDPWWNPAVENQATDRAHRIGQNNKVFVYKLIAKGTVEEKMLELQNKKQDLLDKLFTENMLNKVEISANDLQILFEPLEY